MGNAHFLPHQSKSQPDSTAFIRSNIIFMLWDIRKILRCKERISYKASSTKSNIQGHSQEEASIFGYLDLFNFFLLPEKMKKGDAYIAYVSILDPFKISIFILYYKVMPFLLLYMVYIKPKKPQELLGSFMKLLERSTYISQLLNFLHYFQCHCCFSETCGRKKLKEKGFLFYGVEDKRGGSIPSHLNSGFMCSKRLWQL